MRKLIIMGAGGRDFHNFNVAFREDPETEAVAFTAAQIPGLDDRVYPPALAEPRYPKSIPCGPSPSLRRVSASTVSMRACSPTRI
jgi:predicted GTPase